MNPDELKAELAQLAAENKRLREGLWHTIEKCEHYFVGPATMGGSYTYNNYTGVGREALQTQPTPGLGAAMLRVVEAAVALMTSDDLSLKGQMHPLEMELDDAVQALNELEAKHEP